MPTKGPLDLACEIADILDELGVPYALGGSMASSLVGEPRTTIDVDVAVDLDLDTGASLLAMVEPRFYVPRADAEEAIRAHTAFNLLDTPHALKVDLFVLGAGLLDRRQIERRVLVVVPGVQRTLWVTSPEDQVLRKLDWRRQGGSVSDRQWRDVVGILRVHGDRLDLADVRATATEVGLSEDLAAALAEAGLGDVN